MRWYASTALRLEIKQNPDPLRRVRVLELLSAAHQTLVPRPETLTEAARLVSVGVAPMDGLHLALAHEAGVDSLITTDDRFIRTAERRLQGYRPAVVNPVDWFERRRIWLLQRPSP